MGANIKDSILRTARAFAPAGKPQSKAGNTPAVESQKNKAGSVLDKVRDTARVSDEARTSKTPVDDKIGDLVSGLFENFGDHKTDPQTDPKNGPQAPDLSPENIEELSKTANETNDPNVLNEIDSFRSQLPPEQQQQYDEQLQKLREDKRIRFVEEAGAEADLATRDFALRGILTSTFGSEEDLEKALDTAAHSAHNEKGELVERPKGDGTLDIHIYPDEFPLYPLTEPGGEKISGGLVTSGGDIYASKAFLQNTLSAGENLFTHEFAHVVQGSRSNGKWSEDSNTFPEDFPDGLRDQFETSFNSPEFQAYFDKKGLNAEYGQESYPGVQNVFRYYPEELKKASPELYELMTKYQGYDPLKGENVTRQTRPENTGILDRVIDGAGDVITGIGDFFGGLF